MGGALEEAFALRACLVGVLEGDLVAQTARGGAAAVEPTACRFVERPLLALGERGDRGVQGSEPCRDRRALCRDFAAQLPVLVVVLGAEPADDQRPAGIVPGRADVGLGAEFAASAAELAAREVDGERAAGVAQGALGGGEGALPFACGQGRAMAGAVGGLGGGRAGAAAAVVGAAGAGAAVGGAAPCHGSTVFRAGEEVLGSSYREFLFSQDSPRTTANPAAMRAPQHLPATGITGNAGTAAGSAAHPADDALVALWLHGRPPSTIRAYAAGAAALRAFLAPLPLAATTLATLQAFSDTLAGSPAYRRRQLAAIKSLLHFGQRVGAMRIDVGAALQLPRVPARAAERVLTEAEVEKLLAAVDGRDRALLRVLYASGARVAELVGLTAGACVPDPRGGGAITLHGKRGSRTVRLGPRAWAALEQLRQEKPPEAPVLGIGIERVRQILARAATRAGLQKKPSPHWLRHSHGTHAHRAGASAALIRDTLGHASIATTDTYLRASPDDGSALWLE